MRVLVGSIGRRDQHHLEGVRVKVDKPLGEIVDARVVDQRRHCRSLLSCGTLNPHA